MKKTLALLLLLAAVLFPACQKPASSAKPSAAEPVAAFPEPVSYDLTIDTDYEAGTIAGDCALVVKNATDAPIPVVPLNLYRLMEVASVSDASGKALPFDQSVRIFKDWKEFQANHIRVRLEPPLAPGKETTLRIKYGGPLLGYAEAMRYVKDHVGQDLTLIRSDSLAFPQIGVPSWETNRAAGLKNFTYRVVFDGPLSARRGQRGGPRFEGGKGRPDDLRLQEQSPVLAHRPRGGRLRGRRGRRRPVQDLRLPRGRRGGPGPPGQPDGHAGSLHPLVRCAPGLPRADRDRDPGRLRIAGRRRRRHPGGRRVQGPGRPLHVLPRAVASLERDGERPCPAALRERGPGHVPPAPCPGEARGQGWRRR